MISRNEHANGGAGPLQGVRVIDLTTILLGPFATQILGDMGADVLKVEAPGGDATRHVGPPPADGMGAVFLGCNRNKRSIVLDLKQAVAREALLRLAAGADVFVHNMRPQAVERLGLGYADLAAARADIVYCASYGFRAAGPYGNKAAFDDMIQAASGLAALQNRDAEPHYVTSAVVDKITGMAVANAVSAALFHRQRSGRGQCIEVPMFETMVNFNMVEHLYGRAYEPARGRTGYPRTLSPDRRPYATKDGFIGALPYTDRQWQAFFELAERPDLAADPRYQSLDKRLANIDALYADVSRLLATRTSAEWLEALDAANIPAMPVHDPDELPEDAHLAAGDFWDLRADPELGRLRFPGPAARFSATPGGFRRLPPRLGEHSVEILAEAGYAEADIAAMLATGATHQHAAQTARGD
ncbi:MAG: CoA transferase [Gammaproteobacteria bacterium]|nr:CoA transferase [Gammaproteobacteria bacterium]NIP87531.1 CoA transferase [Gammaproteobacteria bacterium]NIR21876.1 CoA transferase [Gammaproteobacteria bacterium]NIS03576.1 CoA transferase [Gammaproteobacteria bacterium]NIU40324.1 CoA transferase [Gammaproteobacteria bacterium]